MTHCVYRHIRPDTNEVFYVGLAKLGTSRPVESRRRTDWWNKVVNKNEGNYRVDILMTNLTLEEANQKEVEFIKLYGRLKDGTGTLVNLQLGGRAYYEYKLSTEQKIIAAQNAKKGKALYTESKQRPPLTRRKKWYIPRERSSTKGCIRITNGVITKMILASEEIPQGWRKGEHGRAKLTQETRDKMSATKKGMSMNFTTEQRRAWTKGNKSCLGKVWITDGVQSFIFDGDKEIPEGYKRGRHHITNPAGFRGSKKT